MLLYPQPQKWNNLVIFIDTPLSQKTDTDLGFYAPTSFSLIMQSGKIVLWTGWFNVFS